VGTLASLVQCDDWKALYINGELAEGVQQHHRLDIKEVILAAGRAGVNGFESIWVEDAWVENAGQFPQHLNDIPTEVRYK
jgi:hypothetical protein